MSIGTAAPTQEELQGVPHHLLHHLSVQDDYSAGKFEKDALAAIHNIFTRHPVAIMVGGSGLYINAVCNGIDDLPKSDERIRQQLIDQFENEGIEALQAQIKTLDPEYYATADLQNTQRLMRAIEVCLLSQRPYSSFLQKQVQPRPFNIIKIGLNTDRELLYNRINQRVDAMVAAGLLEEAKAMYPHRKCNALQTVGYKELFEAFDEKITVEEAIATIKRNTRRFAKRQLTWFRKDETTQWFEPTQLEAVLAYLNQHLNA